MPDDQLDPNVDIVIDCADPEARIHFDLRVSDVDGEVRRLEGLGARRIDVGQGDEPGFVPMADPEGNEFCVCPGVPLDF